MAWRRLVLDAERACDDAVLKQAEPTAYADQLVVMAACGSSGPRRPMLAMAGRDDLGVRVRAILDSAQERGRAGATCLVLTAATAVAAVASIAPLQAVAVVPALPSVVLVSAAPVDSEIVAATASEPAVVRPVVRLSPSPLPRLRRPRKPDATLPETVRLKPDITWTPIVDRPSDEPRAFVPVTDAQVPQTDQTDAAAPGRRMWILVLDASLQPDQMATVAESAGRWVNTDMSNADMVSVVTVGTRLTVVKDFTASREDLLAALQSPALSSEAAAGAGAPAASRAADTALEPFGDFQLRALATLCNVLAPIQQRKSLLYFSFGMNRGAAKEGTELSAMTDACRRANVLIYPVDARGLANIRNRDPNSPGGLGLFRGR
jgi:hypothetical protein